MGRQKRGKTAEKEAMPTAVPFSLRRSRWIGGVLVLCGLAVAAAFLLRRMPPRTVGQARARLAQLRPRPTELSVVFVTVDTLRADRLGCYGHAAVETPAMDALARDGVVFDNETAAVPLTLPSHASLLTGLLPTKHGIHDNGGFFLDEKVTTLAEAFQDAGYATGAFVGAWVLDGRWGLRQGFDHYADEFDLSKYQVVSLGTVQKPGDEVMDGAIEWIREAGGEALLRLDSPLRSAHALRSSGAPPVPSPEGPLSRRGGLHGHSGGPPHDLPSRPRSAGKNTRGPYLGPR